MRKPKSTVAPGAVGENSDCRYRAVAGRDARFDGQFYFAVTTTGIYCRPSCPSRTPKPAHVRYFPTAAAARTAGFRACKRCLPDAVPGSPDWNPSGHMAGRAMRLIVDGVVEREGVAGLAARLGYSPRQLSRILVAELGAGPLDLARAHRTQVARELLVGTDLPIARIAHAAGFGSIRQFNDTFRRAFDMTPGQLRKTAETDRPQRAHRLSHDHPEDPDKTQASDAPDYSAAEYPAPDDPAHNKPAQTVHIALPLRSPYDAEAVIGFLARRAIPGVEAAGAVRADGVTTDGDDVGEPGSQHDVRTLRYGRALHYARTLRLPHGPGACDVTFTRAEPPAENWRAQARVELTDLADLAPAIARIRRLLDLDADPMAIARTVPHPGIRVPGAADGTEITVRAIVGQQISVSAASTHLSRLADRLGTSYVSRIPGLSRLFPTAEQLCAGIPEPIPGQPPDPGRPLRLPARAVSTVKRVAHAVAAGDLSLDFGQDTASLVDALTEMRGIGPWTADYVAMRLLGDPDMWPEGDLYLRDLDADRAAARYAPWRSYAVMYIWHSNERNPL